MASRHEGYVRPITETGRDNLGNDSLRRLLEALEKGEAKEHSDSRWGITANGDTYLDFKYLNERIKRNTGIEVDESLADNLGFNKLNWILKTVDPLSVLFVGIAPHTDTKGYVDSALATAEIASRAIPGETDAEGKQIYDPFYIRIAGLDEKNGKAIGLTYAYDSAEEASLTRLNISISINEQLEMGKALELYIDEIDQLRLTVPIITPTDSPYETAGFITSTMYNVNTCNIVAMPERKGQYWDHKRVLNIDLNDGDSLFSIRKCGYYIEKGNGILVVGLSDGEANRKDLNSWEINVPTSLKKPLNEPPSF